MEAELNMLIFCTSLTLLGKYEDLFIILFTNVFFFFPPFHTDLFSTLVVWSLFSMISSFAYFMKWQSSFCVSKTYCGLKEL